MDILIYTMSYIVNPMKIHYTLLDNVRTYNIKMVPILICPPLPRQSTICIATPLCISAYVQFYFCWGLGIGKVIPRWFSKIISEQ